MRDHPDGHIDQEARNALPLQSCDTPLWDMPTIADTACGSARKPNTPGHSSESRVASDTEWIRRFRSDGPSRQTDYPTRIPVCGRTSSQPNATRSRATAVMVKMASALGLSLLLALFVGPRTFLQRAEEAAFASWRALGENLANRELGAISEQLKQDRHDAMTLRSLRDSLWTRLHLLGFERQRVVADLTGRGPRLACDSDSELPRLDATIALVRRVIERADSALDMAGKDLRCRELELITLQVEQDLNRAKLVLEKPIGDPELWSNRIARAHHLLGPAFDDAW